MKPSDPSPTSLLSAHSTVYLAGHPDYKALIPLEAEALSADILAFWAPVKTFAWRSLSPLSLFPSWLRWFEAKIMPGMLLHMQLRKRQIEHWVLAAHKEAPIEQLLILGAGLDTLGWRWALESPLTRVIEVDIPSTQNVKALGLQKNHKPENLSWISADLGSETWAAVIARIPAWNPKARTLIIAEGLFMHIAFARVETLISDCLSEESSTLIFSFKESDADSPHESHKSSALLSPWGLESSIEGSLWSKSLESLQAWLKEQRLVMVHKASGKDMQRQFQKFALKPLKTAEGEMLICCQRAPY